ncbi:hypothetical protein PsorP6_015194 [Peronosclerospora sorghi]|uniref:Uncharacterized protein n=1 Tax=Peronosclerospora sorghi TaxID=230839 RepID=A0ACC0VTM2_9STRA|nr:hypothetical protein PsorP6_015194 [Peronosclerospora sorghi]
MRLWHDDDARPFAEYILRVGNGEEPPVRGNGAVVSFGGASPSAGVEIALYAGITRCETLEALINKVYPSLPLRFAEQGCVDGRAILTTKNAAVNQLNDTIAALIPGEEHVYLSADSVAADDDQAVVYGAEFLNTITVAGMPPHRLALKIRISVILLRDLDAGTGLFKETRLIVRRLGRRVIVAKIAGGSHTGEWVHIPRITMSSTGQRWPFTLMQRKFPLQLAFAMTINKSQGQTIETVGIHLSEPVLTHGQLYGALSRASRVSGVALHFPNGESTTNVVYWGMLQ